MELLMCMYGIGSWIKNEEFGMVLVWNMNEVWL